MDIKFLNNKQLILYHCISGSRAYGLATENSDIDQRGVFLLPPALFYSLNVVEQINDDKNDIVFFEIKKFIDLLAKNNPNILELLFSPPDCILFEDKALKNLRNITVLSRLCKESFAGYARTQIKKAKGLNKKIHQPMSKERKTVLDFCYVLKGQGSQPLLQWLKERNFSQENCGLINLPQMKDVYALFYDNIGRLNYSGVVKDELSNDVSLSSIPKGEEVSNYLYFNKDGYSKYCKEHSAYWEWVKIRNEERYENTLSHGMGYDTKNMMHTFRLLAMAEEIARFQKLWVRREDREFLLGIKKGMYTYEELVEMAEEKIERIEDLYLQSDLPEKPDVESLENELINIRNRFYQKKQ